jgi:predicted metalloendopeptidase
MVHHLITTAAMAAALVLSPAAAAPAARADAALACTDFNAYVNSAWEATTEIPADRPWTGSFDDVRRSNARLLQAALAELVAPTTRPPTPGLQRLAAFYRAGMDETGIAQRGLAALAPLLARIDNTDRAGLPALLGELARLQIDLPLRLWVGVDAKDATRHRLVAFQGGLGLPDRDDYFKTDATTQRILAGYRRYAQQLLQAAGQPVTDDDLGALLALETALARASMTPVQRRNPQALYNLRSAAELTAWAPGMNWSAWLQAYTGTAGTTSATGATSTAAADADSERLVVGQLDLARAWGEQLQSAPLATWRHYLRVRLLDSVADHLPPALAQAHFDYRSGVLRGLQTPPPRSELVITAIGGNNGNTAMGEALGELYVSKAFSAVAQARARVMVEDIRSAMRQRISRSPWMSPATQQQALAKLEAMAALIGGPQRWQDYEGLDIRADDYAGNTLRMRAWETQRSVADLAKPVDRQRWNTSPHIVNAFAAQGNRIVFPAGILQPPFFDAQADDASNYGAIGTVIGHEITHHFDDRGRQFDAVGNLRDWWLPADAAAYQARAERVAQLYSSYEPLPGVRINGHQMLGENISDFGGIHIAFEGLQIALQRKRAAGETVPLVQGQTPEQRYFMANALIWRSKVREQALINQLRTGQHSPGRYRVLGPISHMPAFAQAFGCKPGDAMVAADPIIIW